MKDIKRYEQDTDDFGCVYALLLETEKGDLCKYEDAKAIIDARAAQIKAKDQLIEECMIHITSLRKENHELLFRDCLLCKHLKAENQRLKGVLRSFEHFDDKCEMWVVREEARQALAARPQEKNDNGITS